MKGLSDPSHHSPEDRRTGPPPRCRPSRLRAPSAPSQAMGPRCASRGNAADSRWTRRACRWPIDDAFQQIADRRVADAPAQRTSVQPQARKGPRLSAATRGWAARHQRVGLFLDAWSLQPCDEHSCVSIASSRGGPDDALHHNRGRVLGGGEQPICRRLSAGFVRKEQLVSLL